eukprot:1791969-Amphidinium_carterae.1
MMGFLVASLVALAVLCCIHNKKRRCLVVHPARRCGSRRLRGASSVTSLPLAMVRTSFWCEPGRSVKSEVNTATSCPQSTMLSRLTVVVPAAAVV